MRAAPGQARQDEVGQGHADPGCREYGDDNGQGLECRPAEHATEQRAAARGGQQGGDEAGEVGLRFGVA